MPAPSNQVFLATIEKKADKKDQASHLLTFPVIQACDQEVALASTAAPPKDGACGKEYYSNLVTPCLSDIGRVDTHEGHIQEAESIVVVQDSSCNSEDLTSICVKGVDTKCINGKFSCCDALSQKSAFILNTDSVIQALSSVDCPECLRNAVSRDKEDDVSVLGMSGAGEFAASDFIHPKDSELYVTENVQHMVDASSKGVAGQRLQSGSQ